jgi:hypothetical protein
MVQQTLVVVEEEVPLMADPLFQLVTVVAMELW